MPNITLIQSPHRPFNMAYGANPVSLSGLTINEDKYVLQVYKLGAVTPVADIRQSPNKMGRAIFDIQNILQNLIQPSGDNIDGLHYTFSTLAQVNTRLRIGDGEISQYQLRIGYEASGSATTTLQPNIYTTIGGSQPYWQEQFNTDDYIPLVTAYALISGEFCTSVVTGAIPLSDNTWTIEDNQTGDTFLTDYSSPAGIDVHEVYEGDQCTKSFYNALRYTGNSTGQNVRGIEGYWVAQYNKAGNRIVTSFVNNTQANGGGPNITLGQGTTPTSNYLINTIATGPANYPTGTLAAATDHYYIIPVLWTPLPCVTDPLSQTPVTNQAAWRAQRYNVLPTRCIDYSHIQFAWLNSKGMRDQFTFTKKNEKKVGVKKNNFLKEAANYNSNTYNVTVQDRGFTTYSQTLTEGYSADTDYINDAQAKLLEHLFTSPDVMVRFSDGVLANHWQPANVLTASYVQKTIRKDKMFQYTVNFKIAHNIKSQRG